MRFWPSSLSVKVTAATSAQPGARTFHMKLKTNSKVRIWKINLACGKILVPVLVITYFIYWQTVHFTKKTLDLVAGVTAMPGCQLKESCQMVLLYDIQTSNCAWLYKCLHSLAPKYLTELCVPVVDVARHHQLRTANRGLEFSSLQHVKLWSTCVLFCRSLRVKLTSWAYLAININSCLQALSKDISTPADIAPSSLETIVIYCFKCTDFLLIIITYYSHTVYCMCLQ